MSGQTNNDNIHSDRSIRLFKFLRELTQFRSKITRSLDQYEKVIWFNDIPREPECYCIAWHVENQKSSEDGVWLEIQKPKLKPAPKLPNELVPWNFWRIRGSAYYQSPLTALDSLWKTLKDFKIYPKQEDHLCSSEETVNISSEEISVKSKEYFQYVTPEKQDALNSMETDDDDNESLEDLEQSPIHFKEISSVDNQSSIKKSGISCMPWKKWASKPLKDPRGAKKSEVIDGLMDIIRDEGPMPCHRAYRVYCNSLGIQRVGQQIRSIFDKAINAAVRDGALEQVNDYGTTDQLNKIVRITGTPAICLRTKGSRTFDEIPPSEFAELISQISQNNMALGKEELFREALLFYGFVRMTDGVKRVLEITWNIFKK